MRQADMPVARNNSDGVDPGHVATERGSNQYTVGRKANPTARIGERVRVRVNDWLR